MRPEQQARDMLERMGVEDAQSWSTGEVVELANLFADHKALRARLAEVEKDTTWQDHADYWQKRAIAAEARLAEAEAEIARYNAESRQRQARLAAALRLWFEDTDPSETEFASEYLARATDSASLTQENER